MIEFNREPNQENQNPSIKANNDVCRNLIKTLVFSSTVRVNMRERERERVETLRFSNAHKRRLIELLQYQKASRKNTLNFIERKIVCRRF
jgi:hypothetical protein